MRNEVSRLPRHEYQRPPLREVPKALRGNVVRYGAGAVLIAGGTVLALFASGLLGFGGSTDGQGGDRPRAAVSGVPESKVDLVNATPEGALHLLTQAVSWAKPSNQAKSFDGRVYVQTYLDDGKGPGMIRMRLGPPPGMPGVQPPMECQASSEPKRTCAELPGGAVAAITEFPDRCTQRTTVGVTHPNGTSVYIEIASCLEWQGKIDQAGRQILTADQAVAIAADRRWGQTMDASLMDAGKTSFPSLPTFRPAEPALPAPPGIGPSGRPGSATGWRSRKAVTDICLVARSAAGEPTIAQATCADGADQRWQFDYPLFPDASLLQIRAGQRGMCVSAVGDPETPASLVNCDAARSDQLWAWSWDSTWRGYRFRNVASTFCLVARADSPVIQSYCGQWGDQVWLLS